MQTDEQYDSVVDEEPPGTGLQQTCFLCFTRPQRPLAELNPHLDEHRRFLARLEREGKLFAAGPVLDEDNRRDGNGLIILRVSTREEAVSIADRDPFHRLGLRTYDLKPWRMNEGSLLIKLTYSRGAFELL
jgi:uncharacterized protein YciI